MTKAHYKLIAMLIVALLGVMMVYHAMTQDAVAQPAIRETGVAQYTTVRTCDFFDPEESGEAYIFCHDGTEWHGALHSPFEPPESIP